MHLVVVFLPNKNTLSINYTILSNTIFSLEKLFIFVTSSQFKVYGTSRQDKRKRHSHTHAGEQLLYDDDNIMNGRHLATQCLLCDGEVAGVTPPTGVCNRGKSNKSGHESV